MYSSTVTIYQIYQIKPSDLTRNYQSHPSRTVMQFCQKLSAQYFVLFYSAFLLRAQSIIIRCLHFLNYCIHLQTSSIMKAQSGSNAGEIKAPMLIKASLKRHSPQEIYDYVLRNVGDLGMKIKKRQAIIGFQNEQFYHHLINQHKSIMLHGRKLEFELLPKADENYIMSEQEEVVQFPKPGDPAFNTPEFKAKDSVEARVHSCRMSMLEKVNQFFEPTVDETRRKVTQLKLQFKESGPRQREMFSLETAIEKKLKGIEQKYQIEVEKVQKFIRQFSVKPTEIDLQPTFRFEQTWQFPEIPLNRMKFEPDSYFNNRNNLPCKRLCAINGNQFAVSMHNNNSLKPKGCVKLYDVNFNDPKQIIEMDPGAYGLCRVNNFLLAGSYDSTVKFVNLGDSERQVQSTSSLSDKPNISFFDIKILKMSVDKPQILTLSLDNILRKFEVTYDQIVPGLTSLSLEQKDALPADDCITIEILNSEVIIMGGAKKIRKCHLEKKMFKEIPVLERAIKVKKFNENLMAVACSKAVELADLRTEGVVQTFSHMPREMRSLQVVGEHSMMYGALGEIGLLDDRKHEVFPWKSQAHHKGVVYDILKLKNRVVSCDAAGIIHSWKLAQEAVPKSVSSSIEVDFIRKI